MTGTLLASQPAPSTATEPAEAFRAAMSAMAAPVTIVTCYDDRGMPRGLTASAVTSLSLTPPLFLVCIDRGSRTHDALIGSDAFAVHLLGPGDEYLVRRFMRPAEQRFDDVALAPDAHPAPVLRDVTLTLRCVRHDILEGGDHTILVGRVTGVDGESAHGGGLVWHRRGFAHARRP
ncbi:flavin reductase family protein [Streptomyces sp. KM273126]|uniref:flavin reductase family protein n=1 Tax=Streptomyces sp. KM273126 TaxID=2545247 RepID=UPI00215DA803|nr:flavin reductase family protein [Streptomyces sp. KM273126]